MLYHICHSHKHKVYNDIFCAVIINLFQCLSDLPMSDSIYQVSPDVLIESPLFHYFNIIMLISNVTSASGGQ